MTVRNRVGAGLASTVLLVVGISLGGAPAAQEPKVDQPAKDDQPAAKVDLVTRYRFLERYTDGRAKAKPAVGAIHAFRAAFTESIKSVTDAPKGGAPIRDERTHRAIWLERPALIASLDPSRVVTSLRRYEKVRVVPDPRTAPDEAPMLEGITLLVRPQDNGPLVIRLDEGPGLRVEEYRFLRMQLNPCDMPALLPAVPIHLGDTWQVTRLPIGLIGGNPTGPGTLTGRLEEVRPAEQPDGPEVAVFSFEGQVPTGLGKAEVAAHAEFAFRRKPQTSAAAPTPPPIESGGAFIKLSLAQEDRRIPLPDDPRRKLDFRRELVFECQLIDNGDDALPLPEALPKPTPENSWVTFVDPKGRYQVRFPQDMDPADVSRGGLTLRSRRPDLHESIHFDLVDGAQPKIDDFVKEMKGVWAADRVRTISGGPPHALDEADWPGLRVHRIEASLRPPLATADAGSRRHFFGYTVQTSGRSGLTVEALTATDPPTNFRDRIEQVIKEFRFAETTEK